MPGDEVARLILPLLPLDQELRVEVLKDSRGRPFVELYGYLGKLTFTLSLTGRDTLALALFLQEKVLKAGEQEGR